jgi:predicted CopG family antitoxin
MAANAEERLVVLLEARISEFEKRMAKASGTASQSYSRMRRGSQTATRQMESDMVRSTNRINQALATTAGKVGSFGKAFIGGLVGGIAAGGLVGIISQFRDVAASVAEIGDAAKVAGVDVKSFQELKYVAEQNRIGVDSLTDGIKEMNLRADEFILSGGKSGSAAEAFKRLGFDAETLKDKLKRPSELFSEIIGKLGKFDKAAQIRIADEVFGGTGGEKFVQLIEQGEKGIRDTMQSANDLGIVMDEQLITRAAEVDRRFNQIANTVGSTLKSAIVSAADSLAEFIDGFRAFENQMNSTLKGKQIDVAKQRLELENKILETKNNEALSDRNRTRAINVYKTQLAELTKTDAQITNVLNSRIQPMKRSGNDTWTPPDPSKFLNNGSSRDKSAAAAKKEADAVKELIADLEQELAMTAMTDQQRRAAEASRKAGAAATDDERQQIVALSEAIYQEEQARKSMQEVLDFEKNLVGGFISDMRNGASAGEAFANVLTKIADRLQNQVLDAIFQVRSAGGGGGFLSSLFGGGGGSAFGLTGLVTGLFANGTNYAPGGPAVVGERGPELVNLPRGSQVIPNDRMDSFMARQAQSSARPPQPGNQIVNITTPPGDTVEQQHSRRGNDQILDVMIRRTGETYGLKRPVTQT